MKTIKKKLWAIQKHDGKLCMRFYLMAMPLLYSTKSDAKDNCDDGETPIKVIVTVEKA